MPPLLYSLLLFAAPPIDRPVPTAEAAARFTLPAGFQATLFAGEPDVVQPIAFTFDDRGRLWVVECLSYPNWTSDGTGHDRVVIFEDTDNDGHFDKKTVFYDKGSNLSGIALGFGGVWLCSTPNLIFIPIRPGEDRPAGPPKIVLDGWNLKEAQHNVFNGLTWGPDGWLWGCNGIQSRSLVGQPGTPKEKRVEINCGVWRYHPTRKVFEAVAHGTTNPWGLDFDDYGEAFITNCVIKHLWHVVPGAHFERMYGQDINPHSYQLMPSIADHIHWGGGHWTTARGGPANDAAGGGHAHVGCMVYLGDNFPPEYRNSVFMCNLHGNRLNCDLLERRGSTYVGKHGKDFLLANDPWFRGLAVKYGPDGGAFVTDWSDTGECHNHVVVDRTNGRIFKVTYGTPKPWHGDLTKLSDAELVKLQLHRNDWFVRHARRILQERAVTGKLAKETVAELREVLHRHPDETRRLRALWALHAIGQDEPVELLEEIARGNFASMKWLTPRLRAWCIRLAADGVLAPTELAKLLRPIVRSSMRPEEQLACLEALQRVSPQERLVPLIALLPGINAHDLYLPLMCWYTAEPLAGLPGTQLERFLDSDLPLMREFSARRLVETPAGLRAVVGCIARGDVQAKSLAALRDVLRGTQEALAGQRRVPMPQGWTEAYPTLTQCEDAEVRDRARQLAVLFGDTKAMAALRETVRNATASTSERESALRALLQAQSANLAPLLQALLKDSAMRSAAIRGLAAYADQRTPKLLLTLYPSLTDAEKADAIGTLSSRTAYAFALLDAVAKGTVPHRDLSAAAIRQLQGLKDKRLTERITKVWGTVRPASAERVALTAKYKALLTAGFLKQADLMKGRALFVKNCATCHRLFGEGAKIGPELTGSQRGNLDYVLENVLDPSAVVPREYTVTVVELKSGRVLQGIVAQETPRAITVQTTTETVVVPKDEIESRTATKTSMMPEGLLQKMSNEDVRDLVAYLASPHQVPLPPPRK